jgi:hypothetical protein
MGFSFTIFRVPFSISFPRHAPFAPASGCAEIEARRGTIPLGCRAKAWGVLLGRLRTKLVVYLIGIESA